MTTGDLKTDPRTKHAYRDAAKRARRTGVDAPSRHSQSSIAILTDLDATEECAWVGQVQQDGDWATAAATDARLIVVLDGTSTFSVLNDSWSATKSGGDVRVRTPGAEFVVRGNTHSRLLDLSGPELPAPSPSAPARATEAWRLSTSPRVPTDRPTLIETWEDAELLAVAYMRDAGFEDARRTDAGNDGGIDVIANEAVGQVKHFAAPVGAPVVQQLRGAAHDRAWSCFFAKSGFTEKAKIYAEVAGVALFSYTTLGQVIPENAAARHLDERSATGGVPDVRGLADEVAAGKRANDFLNRALQGLLRQAEDAINLEAKGRKGAVAANTARVEAQRLSVKADALNKRRVAPLSEVEALTEEINQAAERVAEAVIRAHRLF